MVLAGPQGRPPPRLVHQTAKDKAARPGPKASDASVDPDAVPLAAEHLAPCQEAVRDCRRLAWEDAPERKVS
jgi:hypothetical protein